jgi:arylsulfatase B
VHEPYEVPDADLAQFSFIDVPVRQYYAAMVHHLDALVAPVVDALKSKGMWENLLCVCFASSALGDHLLIHLRHSFPPHAHHAPPPHSLCSWVTTSDNGGPLAKANPGSSLESTSGANNFPLRGGKIGVMEGGIRLNAFASGGLIPASLRGTSYSGWMHLSDWYATFCALAGVDPTDHRAAAAGLPPIDSLDLSAVLLGKNSTSPRTEIIIGSSDTNDHSGNTIVAGVIDAQGWKLLIGSVDPAFFQGPIFPNKSTSQQPHLVCGDPDGTGASKGPGCLFNVLEDPTESQDVASTNAAKVRELRTRITELQKTVYNPDRGSNDREMCLTGLSRWKGFLGPWLP